MSENPGVLIWIDVRRRLSRESVDLQTAHVHPITGIPCEVPVPKNVICICCIAWNSVASVT